MELELARIFVKVVQNGSFSKAAEGLKIPKSSVSKAIARLESTTGTQLLLRTTRSLTMTAAGRAFYDSCLGPLQTLEDAYRSLDGRDSILSGQVRLTAPEDLGSSVIAPAIGELTKRHPGLTFELHYTDEIVDLVKDGFDLAVRLGRLTESSLRAKKVGEIILIAVASPDYLKAAPKIRKPSDLADHACLSLKTRLVSRTWKLRSKSSNAGVEIHSRIFSNQMTSLMNMAIAGAGVALVPRYLCREETESGRLIRVLPEWSTAPIDASIVSPLATSSSARLKITTDHLTQTIRAALGR